MAYMSSSLAALSSAISSSEITIPLTKTIGFPECGVVVLDRVDSYGNGNPHATEIIAYNGIVNDTLVNCARGVLGTTSQAHYAGASVEVQQSFNSEAYDSFFKVESSNTELEQWLNTLL